MTGTKQQRGDSPKPESASKPAKHAYEEQTDDEKGRDRASEADRSRQGKARGDRNEGNFRNDRERASEAGRKGRRR